MTLLKSAFLARFQLSEKHRREELGFCSGGAGVLLRCPVPEGGEQGRCFSLEPVLHPHQPPPSKVKRRCPGTLCTAHLGLMSIISVLSCWFRGHQLESERAQKSLTGSQHRVSPAPSRSVVRLQMLGYKSSVLFFLL